MSRSFGTVVFSHGKESGPWGTKITAMAAVVRDLGVKAESVDYRGLDDPGDRVRKLTGLAKDFKEPVVLVGSSMGGHVSAAPAGGFMTRGLFLLARAFYVGGANTVRRCTCSTPITGSRIKSRRFAGCCGRS